MSKQTVYKKETVTFPGPQPVPFNPPIRDRVTELYKLFYDLRKTLNITTEKLDTVSLTLDNFVPKEIDITGTWNIGVTGETTTNGSIHLKILKDSVTINGTIPTFNFVTGTTAITFTADETIPTESNDSKLVEKSITLTTPTDIDPFITTINSTENILLSLAVPTTTQIIADSICTFPDLNIQYVSVDDEETA